MARWEEGKQRRGWEGEGRGGQAQREGERSRWGRESRGDPPRLEYDRPTEGWNQGGYERERFDSQADWRDPEREREREPRDDSEWSEYRGTARRDEERHRGGYRSARRRPDEETYAETQRWERNPVDLGGFGGSSGGGAYAGGAYGGGAWGPGGFGSHGRSSGMWEGVAGRGTPPGWTGELERPYRGRDYSGRGPKGYQRSSERITEDVCDALTRHPDIDASDISVRCENGEVILSGTVHDRYEKRMAEDAAERITGVTEVHNEIRVHRPSEEEPEGMVRRGSSESRRGEDGGDEERTRRGSSASRNRSGSKG